MSLIIFFRFLIASRENLKAMRIAQRLFRPRRHLFFRIPRAGIERQSLGLWISAKGKKTEEREAALSLGASISGGAALDRSFFSLPELSLTSPQPHPSPHQNLFFFPGNGTRTATRARRRTPRRKSSRSWRWPTRRSRTRRSGGFTTRYERDEERERERERERGENYDDDEGLEKKKETKQIKRAHLFPFSRRKKKT